MDLVAALAGNNQNRCYEIELMCFLVNRRGVDQVWVGGGCVVCTNSTSLYLGYPISLSI